MTRTVADDLWEYLVQAGVRRCYGIVGDALNPTVAALAKRQDIEFVHVRHEEWGAFAASAEAVLTGQPVAVCGTAGPGITHLINGLMDARHEWAPVIAVAGDVETSIMDTDAIEEVNVYDHFQTSSLYTGRVVNAVQSRAVFHRAINTALLEQGPTVIALPGDVAAQDSPHPDVAYTPPNPALLTVTAADLAEAVRLVDAADSVTIFGGEGCRGAAAEVVSLAQQLQAPVGFSLKGKSILEYANPNAVGMTGLLGYGGCHWAITHADVVLMLGTDFPFPGFLETDAHLIQVDTRADHLGRRVPLAQGINADVGEFVRALKTAVQPKTETGHLQRALRISARAAKKQRRYVDDGDRLDTIRPEYLTGLLDELLDDDALIAADTGTACIWAAHHLVARGKRRIYGSFSWASMANASPMAFGAAKAFPDRQSVALCGDGGFTMLAFGDLITEVQHRVNVVHIVLNNSKLDFVDIEQQEAGMRPWGTDLPNPDLAAIAQAFGATGIRCENPATLRAQLAEALAHRDGPVVVDVVVDPQALSLPQYVPGKTIKGFTLSVAKRLLAGDLSVVDEGLHNVKLL